MHLYLTDKVALVAGGASSFGLAIASALVHEGCTIYLGDLHLSVTKYAASQLGEKAYCLQLDVGDAGGVEDNVRQIVDGEGSIDILVNSAGVLKTGSVNDASLKDWEEICRVNLSGVYYCSKAVLPSMRERKPGRIINIASISAYKGGCVFGNVLYGTTKAGVIALTKGFARDVASFRIRVNAIAPGLADTGMTGKHLSGEKRSALAQTVPCRRLATTDNIAKVAIFPASDASDYIAGETISVDGGFLTQ